MIDQFINIIIIVKMYEAEGEKLDDSSISGSIEDY